MAAGAPLDITVGDIGTSTANATLGDRTNNVLSGGSSLSGGLGTANILIIGGLLIAAAFIFKGGK